MNTKLFLSVLLSLLLGFSSHAATFNYQGIITGGSGGLANLIPGNSTLSGYIEMDVPGPGQTTTDTGIITSVFLTIANDFGNPLFCFSYNSVCASPQNGLEIPITEISGVFLSFDALGQPVSGVMDLNSFSPTLSIEIPIRLDLSGGTFSMASNGLGFIQGEGNFQLQPVPLPGALWLFASAIGWLSLRRKA